MSVSVLISYLIAATLIVIPLWRILPRSGIPGPVALVAIIPFGALILLWIMALKSWPADN